MKTRLINRNQRKLTLQMICQRKKTLRFRIAVFFLGLFFLLLSAMPTTAFAEVAFTDMTGQEWYAQDVIALVNNPNEIIKGYPDGSFGANETLTVDQFITMLVRAGGEKAESNSEYWAIPYLNKAKEMGILKEGDFEDFRAGITREQMAVLMIRWLEKKEKIENLDTSKVEKAVLDFVMVGAYAKGGKEEISEEYREAVKKAYVLGVLTGYEDTSFKPQGILIRAEAATVVMRMLDAGRRATYQPEALLEKKEAELAEHYYGGSKWLDPADESIPKLERAKVDHMLTKGALGYSPELHNVIRKNKFVPDSSADEIISSILYGRENNPYQDQLSDLEKLLLRRVSKEDTEKVIRYLSQKTSPTTNLEVAGIGFMLKNDSYLVLIRENTDLENVAYTMMVNIMYRDEKWKAIEKYYLQDAPVRR